MTDLKRRADLFLGTEAADHTISQLHFMAVLLLIMTGVTWVRLTATRKSARQTQQL